MCWLPFLVLVRFQSVNDKLLFLNKLFLWTLAGVYGKQLVAVA